MLRWYLPTLPTTSRSPESGLGKNRHRELCTCRVYLSPHVGCPRGLRNAVREQHFQLLLEDIREFFKAGLRRVKFVVPGAGLRRQCALPVDECHLRAGQGRQHGGELLKHGLDDCLPRRERRKLAQVEGGLQPWTIAADAAAIGDCEVVSLENQLGGGAQPGVERDQVFVSGTH